MKQRYRLFKRSWGVYYAFDNETQKHKSLGTRNRQEALRLLHAQNEAHEQPQMNLQMARAYLAGSDPSAAKRNWEDVMNAMVERQSGNTKARWQTAVKDKAFLHIKPLPLVETRSDHFLKVLNSGTVSTNEFLRRLHNFALDMSWLPGPVIPKRVWPKPEYKDKRAITREEHQRIIARETNPEREAFYELCWFLGGSQTDVARLESENVDWEHRTIIYNRLKTGAISKVRFGEEVERVLNTLPRNGPLFPYLRTVRECDRGTEFRKRCRGLGIAGVTLHSYRYSWAERAREAGYPERYAQEALGHGSKAVHRAYAKNANVVIPSLQEYEESRRASKVLPVEFGQTNDKSKNTNERKS